MPGDIIILHMCAKNYYHMMYGSLDMVRDGRMCRLTDRKSDIEVGAPPKKVKSDRLIRTCCSKCQLPWIKV